MMRRIVVALGALLAFASPAVAAPVLLISIDGLRPGDVIDAPARGLKVPNLRGFLMDGSYATGVRGILPTVTYPSHTTLITGASPARHGIFSNTTFDPLQVNYSGWYWFASDIKVPTLWQAAAAAGMTVGNVHWPVSVGARGITWNLPQIWRSGHADDAKMLATLATPGLIPELETATGESYAQGIDETVEGDENRGRFAVALIARHRPQFATVYLTGLDHQQHADGPDTAPAHAVLERIDTIVAALIRAEHKVYPGAVIVVVSDHGFAPITRETNLFRAFIDAGLITLDAGAKVKSWEAMPWPSGGSAAVVLARPNDAALQGKVSALLERLKADPANGIAAIANKKEIAQMRGNPAASFFVDFQPGTSAGKFPDAGDGLNRASHDKGTHGYFPGSDTMLSIFMMVGPGIPKRHTLGIIDMRSIAPTLAKIMAVPMRGTELPALAY
jgi:predicted AlkP superfamily pyrophosphatase or phosphodiesterase